jgi:RNA polymerase sigma-70 factor (ECF subfamily)
LNGDRHPVTDEATWVADAKRGDHGAFAKLVGAYQLPVYNLCYRMLGSATEAEDAAQETFVRVYTHLGAYDARYKLSSWILAVAGHYCVDRLRRRRFTWVSLEETEPARPLAADGPQPEESVVEGESRDEIRGLLEALPADDRLVIVLRYWQDLSYTEIAQIAKTTQSAVKSRLHRARCLLAERILARGGGPGRVARAVVDRGREAGDARV